MRRPDATSVFVHIKLPYSHFLGKLIFEIVLKVFQINSTLCIDTFLGILPYQLVTNMSKKGPRFPLKKEVFPPPGGLF